MFSYQGSILAADDLRLTLSPLPFTRSRTCCTLTRFPTSVSRDPRSSLRVFDFRSTSNCFVACLGRSLTYCCTLTLFPRARFAHFSLLFVKFDGRSTSNCFVTNLGRSITYLRTLTHYHRVCSSHFSLLFVKVADWVGLQTVLSAPFLRFTFVIVLKVQGPSGACRSCRRSRRQGVIYHL